MLFNAFEQPKWPQPEALTQPWRVVLDTDCDNEIDDPFAIAHALLSPERIQLEALTAAPFVNERSGSPAQGMEQSYRAIVQLLERMGRLGSVPLYRGADRRMERQDDPVASEATEAILTAARRSEVPLVVLSIGAATNVASALALAPDILDRVLVIWLGGHGREWPDAREFNAEQDPIATRALLESGARVVVIPALGVSSHLLASQPELDAHLGTNALGGYLADLVRQHTAEFLRHRAGTELREVGYAKEIWDVAATALCVCPDWVPTRPVPGLTRDDTGCWTRRGETPIRVAWWCARNPIFADLFGKIRAA